MGEDWAKNVSVCQRRFAQDEGRVRVCEFVSLEKESPRIPGGNLSYLGSVPAGGVVMYFLK